MIKALKQNGIIYTAFKKGKGYEIKEGKYYNFLTKEELEKILNNINANVKIIDYFETFSSTKRPEKAIWANYTSDLYSCCDFARVFAFFYNVEESFKMIPDHFRSQSSAIFSLTFWSCKQSDVKDF